MGKLSDVQLRRWWKAGKPIAGRSDGQGLTFTLSTTGTATWVLRYRHGGRARELTLGSYPDLTLEKARRRATQERTQVYAGCDVAGEKRRTRIAQAMARSLAELAEDYMALGTAHLVERTRRELRRHLDKDILPRIGGLRIEEVTTTEIVFLIKAVAKRSPSVARRVFEILSVIFAHGIAGHLATLNPCLGLKPSAIIGNHHKRRERIKLSTEELRAVLPALPRLGAVNALAVKILLTTCTRKGELLRARLDHVDLVRGLWTIPDEHSKNKKGFVVPLAPPVRRWFAVLIKITGDKVQVLPPQAPRYSDRKATASVATLNAALDRLDLDGVRRFTPHDLRSTARSHLAALGVDVIVAERCLNHSLGGLVAVYDQHDYLDERREALERWAAFLEGLEQPARVVPIRKASG